MGLADNGIDELKFVAETDEPAAPLKTVKHAVVISPAVADALAVTRDAAAERDPRFEGRDSLRLRDEGPCVIQFAGSRTRRCRAGQSTG